MKRFIILLLLLPVIGYSQFNFVIRTDVKAHDVGERKPAELSSTAYPLRPYIPSKAEITILSGQSNAKGVARTTSIPPNEPEILSTVWPGAVPNVGFIDGQEDMDSLHAGRFQAGQEADRFGLDIPLMYILGQNAATKGDSAYMGKAVRGGRRIVYFLETTDDVFRNFTRSKIQVEAIEGIPAKIATFIFVQGESDGFDPHDLLYQGRLERFVDTVRLVSGNPTLPFLYFKVPASFTEIMFTAQKNVAEWTVEENGRMVYNPEATRKNTFLINVNTYGRWDGSHYDAVAMIDLGRRFYTLMQMIDKHKLERPIP